MQTWKESKALYRLLDEPDVTFAALMQPHVEQTREQASISAVVLLGQDTTDIDLSHRRKISGVGQIGNERGRGFFVQTVLAVRPHTREVLGCMAQEPFVRIPAPEGEQRSATTQARRARNGCLDATGAGHWHTRVGKYMGACGRSRRRYVPLFSGMPLDTDPLSRSSGAEPTHARKRGGTRLFVDPGTLLV